MIIVYAAVLATMTTEGIIVTKNPGFPRLVDQTNFTKLQKNFEKCAVNDQVWGLFTGTEKLPDKPSHPGTAAAKPKRNTADATIAAAGADEVPFEQAIAMYKLDMDEWKEAEEKKHRAMVLP